MKSQKNFVFIISFAHLVQDTYASFLAPILPLLIEKLDMSLMMSAFLEIARKLASLFNPFFGLLIQRSDARYFVILSPTLTAISMSLLGIANSYALIVFLLIIAGISSTLFHIPSPTIIKASSQNTIGRGMSYYMGGGELARTIGPLIITGAISLWGLHGTWRLIPFGMIASLILYYKLKDFQLTHTNFVKKREKGDALQEVKNFLPLFIKIAGFLFFQSAMKMAVTLYLVVYLTQKGFSLWDATIALSVLQFFGVIGTFISGNISDKIGRQKTLLFMSSGSALIMSSFLFISTFYSTLFILALLGIFMFANAPILLSIIHELDTKMPTFINSIYMSINFSINSLILFIIGGFGDHLGLEFTYKIAAILAFISIPFAGKLYHKG
ncbi:Fosmidomycin resistance protein [hydrothermal vent metagenome]|uniref:Fosmidomycin resistance protein n=1 Tax=hydrothermal vent metagenome TaxID=652676 RepID=A0A1W1D5E0_9ZZZZ